MGFLDNLLKKEARKFISNVVDNVVDTVTDSIDDAINPNSSKPTSAPSAQPSASSNSSVSSSFESSSYASSTSRRSNSGSRNPILRESEVRKSIEEIVARDFPSLTIRKDVPASEMFAEAGARNYTYGLYLDGQPKAMIMLLDKDNHNLYRHSTIKKAQRACEDQRVPYMNFMLYMSNRPEYIAERFQETIVL